MHTKLNRLKNELFNDIFDQSYRHFLSNGETNQRAFIMAFFPLKFLRQEENKFIIEVRSNNSSRLSNIFNRVTDSKRNEGRFRKRFINAFDIDFYSEIVTSCTFFLRNHDKEKFYSLTQTILDEDIDLSKRDNTYIKHYIIDHRSNHPEKALAMLILWAFHIDSFEKIISVVKEYEQEENKVLPPNKEDKNWQQLCEHMKTYNVEPNHIKDYLDIAMSYGITGQLGAIALHTHIETNIDVNPLIYSEVANNLYYGSHYAKEDTIKSLNYFNAAANTGFGPAQWTMGQMTNHSRHQSNMKNAVISKEYYKRALANNVPLSYNNLGILYYRGLVFHINRIHGYTGYDDCFRHDSASGISEIYYSVKDEDFFTDIIRTFNLDHFNASPSTPEEEYETLALIDKAENYILDNYFIPGYEQYDYFYSAGSALAILIDRFDRYEKYFSKNNMDYTNQDEFKQLQRQIILTAEYYSNYFCTESHYVYGTIIERFDSYDLQNAYEHYFIAAYETPHRAFRFNAQVRFLELHYSDKIMNKKQEINPLNKLLEFISKPLFHYNPEDTLVLRSLELISKYSDLNINTDLSNSERENLIDNLSKEMYAAAKDDELYRYYLNKYSKEKEV